MITAGLEKPGSSQSETPKKADPGGVTPTPRFFPTTNSFAKICFSSLWLELSGNPGLFRLVLKASSWVDLKRE